MNTNDAHRAEFIDAVARAAELMEHDNPQLDMMNWGTCVVGYLRSRQHHGLAIDFRWRASTKTAPNHEEALRLFGGGFDTCWIRNGRDWARMARGWLAEQARIAA